MKIKQTILALILVLGISSLTFSQISGAASCGVDSEGKPVTTSILSCSTSNGTTAVEKTGIWGILLLVINILTAGVGVAAVGGIVYGSVMYTTAGGSAEQTKKAKTILFNTVIGIVAYAAMYAFLNFLIPGGIFS